MSEARLSHGETFLFAVIAALLAGAVYVLVSTPGPSGVAPIPPECVVSASPEGAPLYADC